METWESVAVENLAASKSLNGDEYTRSCISRAYYSAYSIITYELVKSKAYRPSGVRRNPSHSALKKLVMNSLRKKRFSEETRREIAKGVQHLRRFREMADYQPESDIGLEEALLALRHSSRIHSLIRGGEGAR